MSSTLIRHELPPGLLKGTAWRLVWKLGGEKWGKRIDAVQEERKITFSGMRDAMSFWLKRVVCPGNASWAAHVSGHCGMKNTWPLCGCRRAPSLAFDTAWWHLLLQQQLSTDGVSCREGVDMGRRWSERPEPANQPAQVLHQYPHFSPLFSHFPSSRRCYKHIQATVLGTETTLWNEDWNNSCLQAERIFERRDQEISTCCCFLLEIPGYVS